MFLDNFDDHKDKAQINLSLRNAYWLIKQYHKHIKQSINYLSYKLTSINQDESKNLSDHSDVFIHFFEKEKAIHERLERAVVDEIKPQVMRLKDSSEVIFTYEDYSCTVGNLLYPYVLDQKYPQGYESIIPMETAMELTVSRSESREAYNLFIQLGAWFKQDPDKIFNNFVAYIAEHPDEKGRVKEISLYPYSAWLMTSLDDLNPTGEMRSLWGYVARRCDLSDLNRTQKNDIIHPNEPFELFGARIYDINDCRYITWDEYVKGLSRSSFFSGFDSRFALIDGSIDTDDAQLMEHSNCCMDAYDMAFFVLYECADAMPIELAYRFIAAFEPSRVGVRDFMDPIFLEAVLSVLARANMASVKECLSYDEGMFSRWIGVNSFVAHTISRANKIEDGSIEAIYRWNDTVLASIEAINQMPVDFKAQMNDYFHFNNDLLSLGDAQSALAVNLFVNKQADRPFEPLVISPSWRALAGEFEQDFLMADERAEIFVDAYGRFVSQYIRCYLGAIKSDQKEMDVPSSYHLGLRNIVDTLSYFKSTLSKVKQDKLYPVAANVGLMIELSRVFIRDPEIEQIHAALHSSFEDNDPMYYRGVNLRDLAERLTYDEVHAILGSIQTDAFLNSPESHLFAYMMGEYCAMQIMEEGEAPFDGLSRLNKNYAQESFCSYIWCGLKDIVGDVSVENFFIHLDHYIEIGVDMTMPAPADLKEILEEEGANDDFTNINVLDVLRLGLAKAEETKTLSPPIKTLIRTNLERYEEGVLGHDLVDDVIELDVM